MKQGFSLVEVLVSMLILSIFFVAAAKIITTKPKEEKIVTPHGYFECYWDGGTLYNHATSGAGVTIPNKAVPSGKCSYSPTSGAALMNVTVIYPNGQGGYQEMQPFITNKLSISPSKTEAEEATIGSDSSTESDTLVYKYGTKNNRTYEQIKTYLETTNSKSYINQKEVGYTGKSGGIIISW